MVNSDLQHPSIVELARAGNFQAIAHWINQSLSPYGIHTHVGAVRPGCLKILVELPSLEERELPDQWRDYLVRFICHRIWQLNSAVIEGARIAARSVDEPEILWEQAVRVSSPARRQRQQQSEDLRVQVRQTAHRKTQLKTLRSLLISGAPLFAFAFGCILGFSKAPVEQTNAVASSPKTNSSQAGGGQTPRSDTVQAALEAVPVVKHDKALTDPNDPTVTLMFSGDVTLGESFADKVGKDFDHAFAAMDEYRKADLAMVNLEEPLTKATMPLQGKQFNFKADPDSVEALTKGGVDLVTLANNHAMDYEQPGLVETMDTLDKAGILHMGAGRNEKEARRPDIVDVKGQRIAYLAYYGADFQAAGDKTAGTNYADQSRIAADIKSIRDQVDWIVVNFHWGEELATHPADWQVDLAHFTIDQGADVVVGHHPHVLQGAEIYKGRPIAYSLGNFIFGGNATSDYDTAVLKVALKDKQMKAEFLPVEVRDYQPKVVSGDQGNQILKQISDLSTSFKEPMQSPATLDARRSASPEATSPSPFITQPAVPATASPSPAPASPSPAPTIPTEAATPAPSPSPSADATNPSPSPAVPGDMAAPASPVPSPAASPAIAPPIAPDAATSTPAPSLSPDSVTPTTAPSPAADTGIPGDTPNSAAPSLSTDPAIPGGAPTPAADPGAPANPTFSTDPTAPVTAPSPAADTGIPTIDPNLSSAPTVPEVAPTPAADTGVTSPDQNLSTMPAEPSDAARTMDSPEPPSAASGNGSENNAYTPDAQPYSQNSVNPEAQPADRTNDTAPEDSLSGSNEAANPDRPSYQEEEAELPPTPAPTEDTSAASRPAIAVSAAEATTSPLDFSNPSTAEPSTSAAGGPAEPMSAIVPAPPAPGGAEPTVPATSGLTESPFLNAPEHTPIYTSPASPEPTISGQSAPTSSPTPSSDGNSFTSTQKRHSDQEAEQIALAQLGTSYHEPPTASSSRPLDWSAAGQVGANLIPHVSLLAPAIW